MHYKQSLYNYIKVGKEKVAIYNTYSNGIAILDYNEYEKLLRIQDFNVIDTDIQEFVRQGFVIDTENDEQKIVNYCRYRDTFLKNRPIYRILTTTSCNARCFYCYEHGIPVLTMSKKTAENVADYIIMSAKNVDRITLNWFGGEPLLNPTIISLIANKVRLALGDKIVSSTIITNASLFTKELIHIAKREWNLTNIQISLDGLKEYHERRKAYTNILNSFDKTIEIVNCLLAEGLHVSLRLNYDKKNYEDIVKLVYYIKETFGNLSNLTCYAYPLFDSTNSNNHFYLCKEDIPIYEKRMKDALVECGYYNPLQTLPRRTNACFATDPYSCVIDPHGDIYKCTMDMADLSRSIGNVKDGCMLGERYVEWTTPVLPQKCQECIMLPICQGGCRAARLLKVDMNDCAIKKQSIEYMLNYILDFYAS